MKKKITEKITREITVCDFCKKKDIITEEHITETFAAGKHYDFHNSCLGEIIEKVLS